VEKGDSSLKNARGTDQLKEKAFGTKVGEEKGIPHKRRSVIFLGYGGEE